MPDATPSRTSVLLADLGPMLQMGMTGMLAEHGIKTVSTDASDDIGSVVRELRPYAVVLDLDGRAPRDFTDIVRDACPETKVVLWARREDVMEVLDPGAIAPRFVLGSSPDELCAELVTTNKPTIPSEDES